MNSFLERWMGEAVELLSRELSAPVVLEPCSGVTPSLDQAGFEAVFSGGWQGRLVISVDRKQLSTILERVRLTEPGTDAETEFLIWSEILRQNCQATAAAWSKETGDTLSMVSAGACSAAGEAAHAFRVAGIDGQLFFSCDVCRNSEVPARPATAASTPQTAPAKPEAAERASTAPPAPQARTEPPPMSPPASRPEASRALDLLVDVELEASLRFGSREMSLNELLQLGPGDVVELDRQIADPVDLIIGDKIVAHGEVVLVNGNFGLRVTAVAEPRRALESIRCLF